MTNTHRTIAHIAITNLINNITDELHDRALDDYADMIDDYLPALRDLAISRHDIACDDLTPIDSTDDDALDDLAYALDHDPASCLAASYDAIHALAYSYYRD